jgi:hypothetical protein
MQNQIALFHAEEVSKPNKKYSIATTVVAAPTTPANKHNFAIGKSLGGITTPSFNTHKPKNNNRESTAAVR